MRTEDTVQAAKKNGSRGHEEQCRGPSTTRAHTHGHAETVSLPAMCSSAINSLTSRYGDPNQARPTMPEIAQLTVPDLAQRDPPKHNSPYPTKHSPPYQT